MYNDEDMEENLIIKFVTKVNQELWRVHQQE